MDKGTSWAMPMVLQRVRHDRNDLAHSVITVLIIL